MRTYFLTLAVIAIAGCASFSQAQFLVLTPNPQNVHVGGSTRIHVDVRNTNPRIIENVDVSIFDVGRLSPTAGSICAKHYDSLLAGQSNSFSSCKLFVPYVSTSTHTTVSARAKYSSELNVVQLIDMLSEQEYNNRIVTGSFKQRPASYIYNDGNIQLEVGFSEPLPIVIRGKEQFMTLKITNEGNGFVSDFTERDIIITQDGEAIECPTLERVFRISPIGKKFPTISCRVNMPENTNILQNYAVNIKLLYNYEIRASTDINIIK